MSNTKLDLSTIKLIQLKSTAHQWMIFNWYKEKNCYDLIIQLKWTKILNTWQPISIISWITHKIVFVENDSIQFNRKKWQFI